ncbi:putative peptidase family-domain-containing protein [Aspergillus pseudoustus]|uniref:Peptidase family-domain-containing protein n=1 Tax=Aspergillus pseudoustus TaxID=1810923 RepID=A0ABR4IL43_9EURO
MAKRPIETATTSSQPTRRVKPSPTEQKPLRFTNLEDGEVVHQTCLSIQGECPIFDSTDGDDNTFISACVTDNLGQKQPAQHWPLYQGRWKALVMLVPGPNTITITLGLPDPQFNSQGDLRETVSVSATVNYIPLLQLPPLHLAILVARDSPLLIDCPPAKYGGISSAHSDIDAAIAKFRMAAYMWQAATAEDFRRKRFGRRSFRLDEEWSANTTVRANYAGKSVNAAVAKVHIIRTEKTVAQLRDAQVAQQNPRGRDRDALHKYFESAIAASGLPVFESARRPVVAGMILDSHYSPEQSLILGHAALGCHKAEGLSLGIFGSHLAYSWPRFLEEVPSYLVDGTATGDTVGNDNGECGTMRGACFVGQGAFLHEVGHAFGASHTSGIMARGYSRSWGMNFVEHEAFEGLRNEARWDIRDVLLFNLLPHFALPGDAFPIPAEFKQFGVRVEVVMDDAYGEEDGQTTDEILRVACKAGLVKITVQSGNDDPLDYLPDIHGTSTEFYINTTRDELDRSEPLEISVLGGNGKERVIRDAWQMFKDKPFISIPGSDIVLHKQAVHSNSFEKSEQSDGEFVRWAMLLHHRGKHGHLYRATSIDLRVGATMDGAVVYYADGQHENCGPARNNRTGDPHHFGGHASERHDLPEGETIKKVAICREDDGWGSLAGIRMTLSNGESWGHLNHRNYNSDDEDEDNLESDRDSDSVEVLEPEDGEMIVGFYGQSDVHSGFTYQFGILTAPSGVELPDVVYDMPELRNV